MRIFLNIEAETPAELATALYSLGSMAGRVEVAGPSPTEAEPAAEEPKKTRGKGKATEAKAPTEPAVPTIATMTTLPDNATPTEVAEASADIKADAPPAITSDEVRTQIIDLLNDWSDAVKADKELSETIRVDVLAPIMRALGATKIRDIPADKYAMVPALVDESRAKLAEYVEARKVEE